MWGQGCEESGERGVREARGQAGASSVFPIQHSLSQPLTSLPASPMTRAAHPTPAGCQGRVPALRLPLPPATTPHPVSKGAGHAAVHSSLPNEPRLKRSHHANVCEHEVNAHKCVRGGLGLTGVRYDAVHA